MDNLILAYGLILIALFLLAAELFVPSFGLLFVLGVSGLIVGVAMAFNYSATQGIVSAIAIFVIIPIAGPLLIRWWPKTAWGKRFLLTGPEQDQTLAKMPGLLELETLRGRHGKTVTPLRPAGMSEFDGRRVDTISEGMMIEAGVWVRCIDVQAGTVVVRPVDKPPDLADMDTTQLG